MDVLTKKRRVVVVGRGRWGKQLAETARAFGDEVIHVGHADPIPPADLTAVATAPQHRVDCAKRAQAEFLWLELPLGLTLADLEALRGMEFTTGFRWRFMAPWGLVHGLRRVRMEIVHDKPLEKAWVREAGLWRTWGPHWVDILRQLGCQNWKQKGVYQWEADGVEVEFVERMGDEPRRELVLYGDRVMRASTAGWTTDRHETGLATENLRELWARFRNGRPLVSTRDAVEAHRVVFEAIQYAQSSASTTSTSPGPRPC